MMIHHFVFRDKNPACYVFAPAHPALTLWIKFISFLLGHSNSVCKECKLGAWGYVTYLPGISRWSRMPRGDSVHRTSSCLITFLYFDTVSCAVPCAILTNGKWGDKPLGEVFTQPDRSWFQPCLTSLEDHEGRALNTALLELHCAPAQCEQNPSSGWLLFVRKTFPCETLQSVWMPKYPRLQAVRSEAGEPPFSSDISGNHQVSFPVTPLELQRSLSHPSHSYGRKAVLPETLSHKLSAHTNRSEIGDTDRTVTWLSC